ncbi:FAD-dependent oxidoreductase [Janthinobacterium tructae]|jgi:succinate dehydrogenase/fumarate reductase flavoprotein subunit|uniref:FAD-dependent oxidoreductase n=1 Tax=Janthinobacterium tructae TaxID=2590869 RepID=UPI00249CDBB7|nr:FAD-binding protein [Janthinobacterium tructae]MDI3295438.1 FAD-binding protein [Janthinobacterium tructae]
MASLHSVTTWADEADIVIAGFGLAASCAAIEARDLDPDADILILEKMPEQFVGGNSRVAGQSLLISQNAEALVEYQRAMSRSNPIPEDMLQEWAQRMVKLEPWIEARAAEVGATYLHGTGFTSRAVVLEFPEFGAAEAVHHTATILPLPSGVWLTFKANVDKRRIRSAFNARVVDLIQDPDTLEVFGLVIEKDGERRNIKARRGVVMSTGGFENNLDMQKNYFGLSRAYPLGTPGNTGDGLKILQKAGADMWHLRNQGQSGGIWPGFSFPGHDTVFLRQLFFQSFSWIDVAEDNRRFVDETSELQLTHYKEKIRGEWVDTAHHRVGRMHMIFDDVTRAYNRLATTIMTWNTVVEAYPWSEDNKAEIAQGWIVQADSIEELAIKIGRDPQELAATVNGYNAACAAGEDPEYGRSAATLQPIAQGPFYAIELVPAIVCTGGGARRNIESEVLDHQHKPIPRLYEAGELGSMFSNLYQNGSYLTEAMISGRAAGKNAVALSDWQAGKG